MHFQLLYYQYNQLIKKYVDYSCSFVDSLALRICHFLYSRRTYSHSAGNRTRPGSHQITAGSLSSIENFMQKNSREAGEFFYVLQP